MLIFRRRIPKLTTAHRAYVWGRLVGGGAVDRARVEQVLVDAPEEILAAYAVGATSSAGEPLLSAGQLLAEVVRVLAGSPEPAPPPAGTPPAAAPAPVVDEPTRRCVPRHWIGEPMPTAGR